MKHELESSKVKKVLAYRWPVFGILAAAYFLVYFHRVSTAVVSSDLQAAFGVGAVSIALLSSAYFYAYTVMQLPSGLLTDSWGPRRTVSSFILLAAAGAILTGMASSFQMVVFGRLLIGIGAAMVYIPLMKILANWYRRNEFASLSGILLAVGNIGALSAAGPLAWLTDAFGWQQVFLMLGAATILLAAASLAAVRDSPSQMGLPAIQEIEDAEMGKAGGSSEPVSGSGATAESSDAANPGGKISMKEALRMTFGSGRRFWPLAIWFFFLYGSIMVYQGLWAGLFYQDVLGWDKARSGLVLTFIGLGMIFGCPTAGYISDKVLRSRRKVLVIGALLYTVIWGAIWIGSGQIESTQAYMAINFAFGFFGGFFVVGFAQVKELFPLSIVGTSTAALNIFPFAGGAVLQQVSGLWLSDRSLEAYQGLWLFMLLCAAVATVAAAMSEEKEDR